MKVSNITQNQNYKICNNPIFIGRECGYQKIKTAFEKKIPGYADKKDIIFRNFIEPIINPNFSPSLPAFTLCGADKLVLEMFENSIKDFLNEYGVNVIDMTEASKKENFINDIHLEFQRNRNLYMGQLRRSVIVIKEPENILSMDITDTPRCEGLEYSQQDLEILNKHNNFYVVNMFKSFLDYCNKLPQEFDNGYATSFLFITQKPHLLHPHLCDTKMGMLYLDYPNKEDLKQLFYSHLIEKPGTKNLQNEGIKNVSDCFANYFYNAVYKDSYKTSTALDIVDDIAKEPVFDDNLWIFRNIISKTIKKQKDLPKEEKYNNYKIQKSLFKTPDKYEMLKILEEEGQLDFKGQIELLWLSFLKKLTDFLLEP